MPCSEHLNIDTAGRPVLCLVRTGRERKRERAAEGDRERELGRERERGR